MSLDAEPLTTPAGWFPENIMQYCHDNDLCDLDEDNAYRLCEIFTRCPVRCFYEQKSDETSAIVCVLSQECERLFEQRRLQRKDFVEIVMLESEFQVLQQQQRQQQRQRQRSVTLTPIEPDNDALLYYELFDEAFLCFLPPMFH